MRNTLILISFFSLLTGLACNGSSDKPKNLRELVERVHRSLSSNDSSAIHSLFTFDGEKEKEGILELASYVEQDSQLFHVDSSRSEQVELIYLVKGNYYSLKGKVAKEGGELRWSEPAMTPLSELCDEAEGKRYRPDDEVSFQNFEFETMENGEAFRSGRFFLKNGLDKDLEAIKYTFKIHLDKKEGERMIYRRTNVKRDSFPKGKSTPIELPQLNGYNPNEGKLTPERIRFEGSLVDAEPRPTSKWCERVEELDALNREGD